MKETQIARELKKYLRNVGDIEVLNEGHKEIMRLVSPLIKAIEKEYIIKLEEKETDIFE